MTALQLTRVGDSAQPPLVLVHGWGHAADVWRPLVELLQDRYCLHLLDLPGYRGEQVSSSDWQLESILQAFNNLQLDAATWCGWSLGGMLATAYADRYPDQVAGLVTIASNAVFTRRNNWPNAMPEVEFLSFQQALADNPNTTQQRFLALVCQGAASARVDLRALKNCLGAAAPATLQLSLQLLHELDVRQPMQRLTLPQLHILGARDALVPIAASEALGRLNPASDVVVLDDAGHAPLLSHPQQVAELIIRQASS